MIFSIGYTLSVLEFILIAGWRKLRLRGDTTLVYIILHRKVLMHLFLSVLQSFI